MEKQEIGLALTSAMEAGNGSWGGAQEERREDKKKKKGVYAVYRGS